MLETLLLIIVFMACFILLDDSDKKESKRRQEMYESTPVLYEQYISEFKDDVEKKLISTIESCETTEQLISAHKWALNVISDKEEYFIAKYPHCNMSYVSQKFYDESKKITEKVLNKLPTLKCQC